MNQKTATHTPGPLSSMTAFHGSQAIKDTYLARVRAHAAADEIVSGYYWENGKGCAVGCTLHSDNHAAYETELGVPQTLAHLEDRLFEAQFRFDPVAAKEWPERFLAAPKPGADLTLVWARFAHWLFVDGKYGVIKFAKGPASKAAIEAVGVLYLRWINGDKPGRTEWDTARAAAVVADYTVAEAAPEAAADAYAAYAAYYAGGGSGSGSGSGNKHYTRMANKLIELMTEAR